MRKGLAPVTRTVLVFGLVFLYTPIAILIVYSFNDSRLVTVWGGFSLRWYRELSNNSEMLEAAWNSVRVATLSASVATVLGTLAAIALVRMPRFRGRVLFAGLIYAPLVMPEVITGLALLLLFVAMDLDRGFWTITLAHITVTMCFVTLIVQARLISFDTSLEEAAINLGAPPWKAFLVITLPLIWPAIAAGFVLAFALSLDDVIIASFTSGPGSTTLPIRVYSEVRLGVKPEINAISTLFIAFAAIVVISASLLLRRAR